MKKKDNEAVIQNDSSLCKMYSDNINADDKYGNIHVHQYRPNSVEQVRKNISVDVRLWKSIPVTFPLISRDNALINASL